MEVRTVGRDAFVGVEADPALLQVADGWWT